jgi:hypothetical protein
MLRDLRDLKREPAITRAKIDHLHARLDTQAARTFAGSGHSASHHPAVGISVPSKNPGAHSSSRRFLAERTPQGTGPECPPWVQSRRLSYVRGTSASPPTADMSLRRSETTRRAIFGNSIRGCSGRSAPGRPCKGPIVSSRQGRATSPGCRSRRRPVRCWRGTCPDRICRRRRRSPHIASTPSG